MKIIRLVVSGLLGWMMFLACSGPTSEDMASLAAKGFYEHLIRGEYTQFLEGKDGLDRNAAEDYWGQLLDNCHHFMRQQEIVHRGISEVRVVSAKTDTLQKYTNVFMMLCFGDSTNEEIVVPMVERDGRWMMK